MLLANARDDDQYVVDPMDFRNPVTGTAYRLRSDGPDGWRITKAVNDHDTPKIRHLRGTTAIGIGPPAVAIDRLVRGEHQAAGEPVAADPMLSMAEVVLLDVDRIASLATAMASEARDRRVSGTPGFRAGCGHLRRLEQAAMAEALTACKQMAEAWRASGLGAAPGLPSMPEWLAAALDDDRPDLRREPARP